MFPSQGNKGQVATEGEGSIILRLADGFPGLIVPQHAPTIHMQVCTGVPERDHVRVGDTGPRNHTLTVMPNRMAE